MNKRGKSEEITKLDSKTKSEREEKPKKGRKEEETRENGRKSTKRRKKEDLEKELRFILDIRRKTLSRDGSSA